jgi:hypothetical protein
MGNLLTFQEMATRYDKGENAFDLTVEKWVRIREFIQSAFTTSQFDEVLQAAALKVPLCLEHQDNCGLCPLEAICSKGQEGSYMRFMRAIQAYCIAGDLLPKSSLLGLTDQIISELESCKRESRKRVH